MRHLVNGQHQWTVRREDRRLLSLADLEQVAAGMFGPKVLESEWQHEVIQPEVP